MPEHRTGRPRVHEHQGQTPGSARADTDCPQERLSNAPELVYPDWQTNMHFSSDVCAGAHCPLGFAAK